MIDLEDLFQIFKNVDHEKNAPGRLEQLIKALSGLKEVQHASILCSKPEPATKLPDSVYRIPAETRGLLPKGPVVVDSNTPVIQEILPSLSRIPLPGSPVLLFPFPAEKEDKRGALLLVCSNAGRFLTSNRRQLAIIVSKIDDILRIGSSDKREIRSRPSALTPEVLEELMDTIDLPMYIMDGKRTFVSVNSQFLRQYHFSDIEELNQRKVFFFETKHFPHDAAAGRFTTFRNGRNETTMVRDVSTRVGKFLFGILFDMTDHVKINEELKETIEAQKLLNEKLVTTTSILQKTQSTAMKSLARLAEYRDMETGNHLHRICEFNRCICKEVFRSQPYTFSISEDYIDDIFLSGMLHDIGKVGVPDQILLKPGSLNTQEWCIMKKHTEWGWDILHEADEELGEQSFLTLASPIALSHHERYDGTGYPKNLVGEEIPLSARISSLSDVYDALTSHRPYKEAWDHSQAMEEIISNKGKQFDPVLVEIAEDIEGEFLSIKKAFPDHTHRQDGANSGSFN
jgi:response regulator RpfG family c-di-GMP phosphodiesterase